MITINSTISMFSEVHERDE